jgi:hypothetical protein
MTLGLLGRGGVERVQVRVHVRLGVDRDHAPFGSFTIRSGRESLPSSSRWLDWAVKSQ